MGLTHEKRVRNHILMRSNLKAPRNMPILDQTLQTIKKVAEWRVLARRQLDTRLQGLAGRALGPGEGSWSCNLPRPMNATPRSDRACYCAQSAKFSN